MDVAGIRLEHEPFDGAVRGLEARVAELATERAALDRRVDALLHGWSGAAAESFAQAWVEWRRGSGAVTHALATTTTLLQAAHLDLVGRDDEAGAGLTRLARRLDPPR